MAIFTGAGVAIITPFNEDGSINFEEFGKINLRRTLIIRSPMAQTVSLYAVQQVSLLHCQRKNILNVFVQLSTVQPAEFLLLQVPVPTVLRQQSI